MKVLMIGEGLSKQGGIVSVQKLILEEMPSSIQYRHIATLVDGSKLKKSTAFLKAVLELGWTLLSQDIDLIHTHVSERGSAFRQAITTLVALLFRKPVVMHTHGSEFHLFYEKLPKALQIAMSFVYSRCAHFIVLSKYWEKFYVESLGLSIEKVTVLPNAVRVPEEIPQRSCSGGVFLVFLGRIGQRKGAFDLVTAFANLPAECRSKAKLTMAGDGEGASLRALVESLDLTNSISVVDWISAKQRDSLLEQSDVFILPSYNEGLPMALLEAMSWGLSVITTPVGGIPELVQSEKNGLLVQPGNIEQITAATKSLIENKELRLTLGSAARESMLLFGVKPYCASLVDVYRSSLMKGG